ncbi:hypothetical protein HDU97_002776 [Phlyctochytrium planicorne]|nr:hypothetical protein HDU97_002776 [Phlyctochytrium planicorne]
MLKLGEQFEQSKESGTVFITYKRYSFVPKKQKNAMDVDTAPESEREYPCLVRAVCGKSKISTLVEPKDTEKFQEACGNVMRLHMMDKLKKKVKTGAKVEAKKGVKRATGEGKKLGKGGQEETETRGKKSMKV